jgi:ribosome-binding protein aMBF1 (putative translation factor)
MSYTRPRKRLDNLPPLVLESVQMEETAVRVREEMQRRKLSATRLATELQMHPRTVLDFVNGRRPTRGSTRLLICKHLGLEPDSEREAA